MSIARAQIVASLSPSLPQEIIEHLVNEYQSIKQNLAYRRFRPSELDGGRFGECMLRLFQHLDGKQYTPFGIQVKDSDTIINRMQNISGLHDSIRLHIPKLVKLLIDVRNRRNVAHVGGDIDPNFSDSIFISQMSDWIMTEMVRVFYACSIEDANKIVTAINEIHVPIVASVDGFIRIQNTGLDATKKVLVILYNKNPEKVSDTDLIRWLEYSNTSRFRKNILKDLHTDALIHYQNAFCSLLPKGILYVEQNIPMDIIV